MAFYKGVTFGGSGGVEGSEGVRGWFTFCIHSNSMEKIYLHTDPFIVLMLPPALALMGSRGPLR